MFPCKTTLQVSLITRLVKRCLCDVNWQPLRWGSALSHQKIRFTETSDVHNYVLNVTCKDLAMVDIHIQPIRSRTFHDYM